MLCLHSLRIRNSALGGPVPGCGAWNTMEESVAAAPAKTAAAAKPLRQRPGSGAQAMLLRDIPEDAAARLSTGIGELDRVLGGGIVEGGLMLLGGDPGIGKSTLLTQASANMARAGIPVLYASGEESARQIKLRARRLGAEAAGSGAWPLMCPTCMCWRRPPWIMWRSG